MNQSARTLKINAPTGTSDPNQQHGAKKKAYGRM